MVMSAAAPAPCPCPSEARRPPPSPMRPSEVARRRRHAFTHPHTPPVNSRHHASLGRVCMGAWLLTLSVLASLLALCVGHGLEEGLLEVVQALLQVRLPHVCNGGGHMRDKAVTSAPGQGGHHDGEDDDVADEGDDTDEDHASQDDDDAKGSESLKPLMRPCSDLAWPLRPRRRAAWRTGRAGVRGSGGSAPRTGRSARSGTRRWARTRGLHTHTAMARVNRRLWQGSEGHQRPIARGHGPWVPVLGFLLRAGSHPTVNRHSMHAPAGPGPFGGWGWSVTTAKAPTSMHLSVCPLWIMAARAYLSWGGRRRGS
jgi:hypothetical protein